MRWAKPLPFLIAILLSMSATICVICAAQAEVACHRANIHPVSDPAIAYQARGNRCEGIYAVPVSTTANMQIVGFHAEQFPATPLDKEVPTISVKIERPAFASQLLLQAVALRPLMFYAMDTVDLATDGTFGWDTQVLGSSALALRANELGMLACTALCNPTEMPLYLPVRMIAPRGRTQGGYVVVLQAQRELSKVDWEVDSREQRISWGTVTGPFPSRRPIFVSLGTLQQGQYTVRLSAHADDGSRSPQLIRIQAP